LFTTYRLFSTIIGHRFNKDHPLIDVCLTSLVCISFTVQLLRNVLIADCAKMLQMLFCVGDFFGNDDSEWQQVISGTIKGRQCILLFIAQKCVLNNVYFVNKTEHVFL